MKEIPISEISPDTVLAKNIYNTDESLLMAKGTILTAENIKALFSLGVRILWIEVSDEKKEPSSEDIKRITQEVEKLLEKQFERVMHNPIMLELKEIFSKYLIEKGSYESTKS